MAVVTGSPINRRQALLSGAALGGLWWSGTAPASAVAVLRLTEDGRFGV